MPQAMVRGMALTAHMVTIDCADPVAGTVPADSKDNEFRVADAE